MATQVCRVLYLTHLPLTFITNNEIFKKYFHNHTNWVSSTFINLYVFTQIVYLLLLLLLLLWNVLFIGFSNKYIRNFYCCCCCGCCWCCFKVSFKICLPVFSKGTTILRKLSILLRKRAVWNFDGNLGELLTEKALNSFYMCC